MALATQCPHCYTSFRVANDQLKLHAGMVRCGACKQTFNGIEHLLEPGQAPRTPPLPTTETVKDSTAAEISTPASHEDQNDKPYSLAPEASVTQETAATETDEASDKALGFEDIEETPVEEDQQQAVLSENTAIGFADIDDSHPQDAVENIDEAAPSQQELDDIALFQAKLASFAPQIELPITAPEISNDNDDQQLAEHASTQLEMIDADEDLEPTPQASDDISSENQHEAEVIEPPKKTAQASLTASLDFELNDEERAWSDSSQISQLEVQTQAAIVDGDDSKYSRHEPVFSEPESTTSDNELEQDLQQLLAETKTTEPKPAISAPRKIEPSIAAEPIESTKDPEPEYINDIDDEKPDFVLRAEKARRYGKLTRISLWLGVFLLLLSASAQGIYFFRSGIAAHFPQTKPLIQQMCQKLSCQIKLPTQIDAIVFDSTELLTLNQDPNILSLSLQLQNKSSLTQAWPMLELTLKDSRGKTVLQRVFTPEEYLENKAMVAKGFAANSDSSIKVHFELNTMKAANYAVGVFYP